MGRDMPFDLFSLVGLLKLNDLVHYATNEDQENIPIIGELQMRAIMKKLRFQYAPESVVNPCIRGLNDRMIPKYDWECVFTEGTKANLRYFEANDYYQLAKVK